MANRSGVSGDVLDIPRPSGSDIDRQAEEWLVYLYSGAASEEGHRQFSDWLQQSVEHVSAYTRIEQLWRDLGFVIVDPEEPQAVATASPAEQETAEQTPVPLPAPALSTAAPAQGLSWAGRIVAVAIVAMLLLAYLIVAQRH